MMSEPSDDLPRRLHPISIVLQVGGYLRQLLLPFLVLLLFSRGEAWELYASLVFLPLAGLEVLRYWRTTYAIRGEQLIVRQGLLFRSERHIPFQRIQNLDLAQNLVQRLFGVAEVRIETASGAEPEAILKVLALGEVGRIRERIFSQRGAAAPVAGRPEPCQPADLAERPDQPAVERPRPVPLLHLPLIELVKLGLITYRGLAVVGVVFGLAWQLNLFESSRRGLGPQFAWLTRWAGQLDETQWWLAAAALALAGLTIVTGLSVLWAILTLYDYQLIRVGDDLRVSCGLFTRLSGTIPRGRIQLVSIRQTPLHRLFARVTISIETAGGGGSAESVPISRRWLVPLVRQERVPELLHEIQPDIELLDLDWQRLAPAAAKRMVRKAFWLSLLLMIPLATLWDARVLVCWPILALGLMLYAWAAARGMGYARSPHGVAFRSGVLTRRVSATRFDRIQAVVQRDTPFDRRWGMASVAIDTAGAGAAGHRIEIPYLECDVAVDLRADLAARAERAGFAWA